MKNLQKNTTECGPFIACGAAAVDLNHDPDEPTSIDRFFDAVKRIAHGDVKLPNVHRGQVRQPRTTAHA